MQRRFVLGLGPKGFHRLAYTEWGTARSAPPVVCLHGLTRNSRDFDFLCADLARHRHAFSLDAVGRGQSDYLSDFSQYGYPQYIADANTLIARIGREQVDWVGSSMGGLVGMMIAAMGGHPIRRMVMVDVGPFLPKAGLDRIAEYIGGRERFATRTEARAYLAHRLAGFGPLTEAHLDHLTAHGVVADPDGRLRLAYDANLAKPYEGVEMTDVDLWAHWESVNVPVLVVHGAHSDLLLQDTIKRMRQKPGVEVYTVLNCGHCPLLMADDQIKAVREFLAA
jgi:pimeloyl-ACP methyl ester carboxylesterase